MRMSPSDILFASGCFELRVQTGAVSVRGATITSEDGSVQFASSKPSNACRLQVAISQGHSPLVLALDHLAAASFTLQGLVTGCWVTNEESNLDERVEELDGAEEWHQVL